MNLQRHELVYVAEDSPFCVYSMHFNRDIISEQVRNWLAQKLPCVFARQLANREGEINLGLPLFNGGKKQRVGLKIKQSAVLKYQSLPSLCEMQDFFVEFHEIELNSEILNFDLHSIKVYGSFLFQYLSGEPYVDLHSDLDLLIDYPGCSLHDLNELFTVFTKKFKRCIDGELRLSDLGDLAIKELFNRSAEKILLKNKDRIELISRAILYERYPSLCVN